MTKNKQLTAERRNHIRDAKLKNPKIHNTVLATELGITEGAVRKHLLVLKKEADRIAANTEPASTDDLVLDLPMVPAFVVVVYQVQDYA